MKRSQVTTDVNSAIENLSELLDPESRVCQIVCMPAAAAYLRAHVLRPLRTALDELEDGR